MRPTDITEDSNHAGVDRFEGFSIWETGGSDGLLVEFRKAGVSGQHIAGVQLAAGGSATVFFPTGMSSEGGVYVATTGAGTLDGVLYGA